MDSLDFWTSFGRATVALLIVVDPLSIMPVLLGLTSHMEPGRRVGLVLKVVGGATVLLLFFTFTGVWLLSLFAVTLDDLRIGGGLLLLVIAIRLVVEGRIGGHSPQEYNAAVVPLISPLLIGPGAITAAVVLAAIHGVLVTALAGVVTMLVSLALFLTSGFFHRLLGDSGADLISRIMGVLIAAIAVSYIRLGVLGMVNAG